MLENKQVLRHRLLNIFTILNYHLLEEEPSEKNRDAMLELIKLASCLVEHEDLFLTGETSFFIQDISIRELIETVTHIHEDSIKERKTQITLPEEDLVVPLDRHYMSIALGNFLLPLIKKASSIEFSLEPKSHQLFIKHDGGKILPEKPRELIECIKAKGLNYEEISIKVAQMILSIADIELNEKDGELALTFPVQTEERV